MNLRSWRNATVCIWSALVLAGCQKPQPMDMSAMQPPERAKELDLLESWVGTWSMTLEMTMGGQTTKSTGTVSTSWECDKRVLFSRSESECTGMGPEPMKETMLELYTWNPKTKKFNTYFFNNGGWESRGEMTFDANTKTFHITGKGPDPMTGKMAIFEGSGKLVDSSTMEWTMAMWDGWKMKKSGEGRGTMKRI